MYESSPVTVNNSFPIRNWETLGVRVCGCNETFQIEFKDVALWGLTSGQWCRYDPPRVGKSGLDCENSRSVWPCADVCVMISCNCSLMSCITALLHLSSSSSSARLPPVTSLLSVLSGAPYQTALWFSATSHLFISQHFISSFFLEVFSKHDDFILKVEYSWDFI